MHAQLCLQEWGWGVVEGAILVCDSVQVGVETKHLVVVARGAIVRASGKSVWVGGAV